MEAIAIFCDFHVVISNGAIETLGVYIRGTYIGNIRYLILFTATLKHLCAHMFTHTDAWRLDPSRNSESDSAAERNSSGSG